jgi:hypothetical protein
MTNQSPVTAIFKDLVRLGQITPVEQMENLRLPGELPSFPSITSYGTPEIPIRGGVNLDAKLEQRS